MQLFALLPLLALSGAPAVSATSSPQPRAVGVIARAMKGTYSPPQVKRQTDHNHDHFDVVFPQSCIADCQRMVEAAGQMESAAYQAQATERVGGQIGPDLDDDRISDSVREGICTTETVRSILSCVNCAYGHSVPNLSEDDAEDVIDWFEDFCDDTRAWEDLDDDDDDDVTARRTATGPFTTATNVHLPVGFTDYPRAVAQTQGVPSGSASGPSLAPSAGSPTTGPSASRSSAPATASSSSAALPNVAVQGGLGIAALGFFAGALL